ncbi:programmed cell death 1 ligand 1-like isoform X5 [Thunnus thynnus]|uniref:programmed cell death 1 ligand 1-like isoform X5 n=1 Tax=Thunnus thynnus TaxID=8237 RepID=UPI00352943F9
MICRILLLISLTSCVCGTFVLNVTETSYQAEENHNITLEWMFTTKTDSSSTVSIIICQLLADVKLLVLYHLYEGVEDSEFQDGQFAGRVQCDKDALREGRIRLHVSRIRTDDSGLYMCKVRTDYGRNIGKGRLNVTAARDRPEPETPNTASRERIGLYCVLGLTAAAISVLAV